MPSFSGCLALCVGFQATEFALNSRRQSKQSVGTMYKSLSVLLVALMSLSACSGLRNSDEDSSDSIDGSTSAPAEVSAGDANALVPEKGDAKGLFKRPEAEDNSVPIAVIKELRIDPNPTGAIIYAAGTAIRQGAFNAQLARIRSEELSKNGIMEFTFRVAYPEYATVQGTDRSHMVSDAVTVSTQDLEGIRLVRVVGQQNALESHLR